MTDIHEWMFPAPTTADGTAPQYEPGMWPERMRLRNGGFCEQSRERESNLIS
jgi:hypothetical protein